MAKVCLFSNFCQTLALTLLEQKGAEQKLPSETGNKSHLVTPLTLCMQLAPHRCSETQRMSSSSFHLL